MSTIADYLAEEKNRLQKALAHLNYSLNKIKKLSTHLRQIDDETLQVWESFYARFGRVSDIFLTRYLRALILQNDPGFGGSLRDFVNQAEKLGYIDNAETWMGIRELRNIATHEYTDKELAAFFLRLRDECPTLLSINKLLK